MKVILEEAGPWNEAFVSISPQRLHLSRREAKHILKWSNMLPTNRKKTWPLRKGKGKSGKPGDLCQTKNSWPPASWAGHLGIFMPVYLVWLKQTVRSVHPELRGRELGWEPWQREKRANLGSDPLLRSDWMRGQGRHEYCCLRLSAWFTWMAPPSTRLPRLTSGPRLWLLAVDTRPSGQSQGSPQHTHGRLRADGGLLHHQVHGAAGCSHLNGVWEGRARSKELIPRTASWWLAKPGMELGKEGNLGSKPMDYTRSVMCGQGNKLIWASLFSSLKTMSIYFSKLSWQSNESRNRQPLVGAR